MSTSKQTSDQPKVKVKLPAASGNGARRPPSATGAKGDERSGRGPGVKIAAYLAAGVLALAGVYALTTGSGGEQPAASSAPAGATAVAGPTDSRFPFEIGAPGPGAAAPPFTLPSTDGRSFDLAAQRGDTVLLYFQEGIGCQPCWDQMKAIEQTGLLKQVGVDRMVSITTQPLDQIRQKASDEGIATPVLADPDLSVSVMYEANRYGMMGEGMDGHSFVLIDGKGKVLWRADYGGAPNYSMFIPVEVLKADIQQGLKVARAV